MCDIIKENKGISMIEYKIISAFYLEELEEKVQKYLNKGFKIQGSIYQSLNDKAFIQSLIKDSNTKKEKEEKEKDNLKPKKKGGRPRKMIIE